MELAGRIAVVTGGGYGMGRELVRQLAQAGCHVAACDVSESGLEGTAAAAATAGIRVTTHLADVSSETDLQRFAGEVRAQHRTDHIHLLFNNAGIGGGGSLFADSREAWERTFDIDWGGVYLGVRTFLPMLMAADEGKIINTSSVNGLWASIGPKRSHTAYAAAKFAVRGFTEALMNDLRLNAPHLSAALVMPGHIGTGIVANSRKVAQGIDTDDFSDLEIQAIRARMSGSGLPVENLSDAEVEALVRDGARSFEEKAPTTASEAATVILDGVRADKWRILIGDDAHVIDEAVRRDPENAYTQEFFNDIVEKTGWQLGGL